MLPPDLSMRSLLANEESFRSHTGGLLNQDGLLPCLFIDFRRRLKYGGYLLKDCNLPVFPVAFNSSVAGYISDSPNLWAQASIRVTHVPSICGSAPIFGVPFEKALNLALQQGQCRSKFFFPERFSRGRHETLLLQLDRIKQGSIDQMQLQVWQYTPNSNTAHYLHALSSNFHSDVSHLDCALIHFNDSDLDHFLRTSRKVKGDSYEKYFRLDGQIEITHMHNLARAFFLTEELYNEAFQIENSEFNA